MKNTTSAFKLSTAIFRGDTETVRRIVEARIAKGLGSGADEMVTPMPLLHQAAAMGSIGALEVFLNHGANPNLHLPGYIPATPLYQAANHHQAASCRVLLAAGADPNIPNDDGVTPLLAVVCAMRGLGNNMAGAVDCLKMLLNHGADVLQGDKRGETPLSHVRKTWSKSVLRDLVLPMLEAQENHQIARERQKVIKAIRSAPTPPSLEL